MKQVQEAVLTAYAEQKRTSVSKRKTVYEYLLKMPLNTQIYM